MTGAGAVGFNDLDSVIGQSYSELEIIVVDDKSTAPATLALLDSYASKDSRIKLIHNEKNGGLPLTRNIGVSHATGKYLTFLDSDDLFTPECLERLVQALEHNGTELVLCQIENFTNDNRVKLEPFNLSVGYDKKPFVDMQKFIQETKLLSLPVVAYGNLFLLDVYKQHKMDFNPRLRIWEDNEWFCRIMPKIKSFSFLDFVGVKRRVNYDSISCVLNYKKLYQLLIALEMSYHALKKNNLAELYAEGYLYFVVVNLCKKLEQFNEDTEKHNLYRELKELTQRCGYTLVKEHSKLTLDPNTHTFTLVFRHGEQLIGMLCDPTYTGFIEVLA